MARILEISHLSPGLKKKKEKTFLVTLVGGADAVS